MIVCLGTKSGCWRGVWRRCLALLCLLLLGATWTGCVLHQPHVAFRLPSKTAPLRARQDAYERYRLRTPGVHGKESESLYVDTPLVLRNGRIVWHWADLRRAVPANSPTSSAAQRVSSSLAAETRWRIVTSSLIGIGVASIIAGVFFVEPQAGETSSLQLGLLLGGAVVAVGGAVMLPFVGRGGPRNRHSWRFQVYRSYDQDLALRLGLQAPRSSAPKTNTSAKDRPAPTAQPVTKEPLQ